MEEYTRIYVFAITRVPISQVVGSLPLKSRVPEYYRIRFDVVLWDMVQSRTREHGLTPY